MAKNSTVKQTKSAIKQIEPAQALNDEAQHKPISVAKMNLNTELIRIRGARTHNLKNIALDLPRHQMIVITGLSGSGKSSLAFDTLYAEGQRRYVESLSAYARQFLQLMEKPDVDLIEGLSPAISIEQKATSHNPRSTVGTVTEIHDYLRLLFARVGTPYCPDHEQPLIAKTISEIVDLLLAWQHGTKLMLIAPVVKDRKGEHIDLRDKMVAQGFVRFRVNGQMVESDDFPKLKKTEKHSIDVVVDRIKIQNDGETDLQPNQLKQRLAESLETALRLSDGRVVVVNLETQEEHLFSNRFACPVCDYALSELEPRLFSFNNPAGACPTCDGLGVSTFFDPNRIVPAPDLSLAAGAIKGWDRRNPYVWSLIESVLNHYKASGDTPFKDLPPQVKQAILQGSGKEEIEFTYEGERGRFVKRSHPFEGIIPNFERRYRETDSTAVREELLKLQTTQPCPDCEGARLKKAARYVRLGQNHQQKAIFEIARLPLRAALDYFEQLSLSGSKKEIAEKVIQEIKNRLHFLNNVGLDYLSLDRSAETLSGGEAQRIRLASQIGSGLTGVMYVLDEPSIGLHQRDNDRLIETLKHLRDLGNTIIVVEHDEDMIRQADFVVDMGIGAGVHGGEVIFAGQAEQLVDNQRSLTGQYLSGVLEISIPKKRHAPQPDKMIRLQGACGNNLKEVDAEFPVGLLTCVTGVSGSGKSTLVNDTLYAAAAKAIYGSVQEPAPYKRLSGLELFDKVINVDQSPIGRTPRSNPATYTGLMTPIRELFSQTITARERGYEPGRFSFNVKGGRCEACQGDGVIKVEMHFLPDVYVPCDVCQGKRYNRETLDVLYKGKNIHDILEMTVEDAAEFFSAVPMIHRKLNTLLSVGLGYIKLGQSATTLSGGEAQRVKLSLELSKRDTGKTLYILDEPTTGLHFHDIALLLKVIMQLRDAGNTIVIIEHNLDVIKTADWLIDMGPEGGAGGGRVLAVGTPEDIAQCKESFTGRYLREMLA